MYILIVSDNPPDTEVIREHLLGIPGWDLEIRSLNELEPLPDDLTDEEPPEFILLSYRKPGKNGLEFLRNLQHRLTTLPPVLVIAGQGNERIAVEFMKEGVFDYLLKDDISKDLLRKSIRAALEKRALEKELAEANRQIHEMAFNDGLTGLFNRHFFNEALKREHENAIRYNYPLSCIMADLDYFKDINDRFGHIFGDVALRQISEIVQNMVRRGDVAARYGGDEFVILLPHTEADGAMILADRIRTELYSKSICDTGTEKIHITASFGISSLMPGSVLSREDLLNKADDALYQAKKEGKNRISVWDENLEFLNNNEELSNDQLDYYKKSLQRIQLKVKAAYLELTESLVKAIESRDPLVVDFSRKVMDLSVSTAMEMGLPEEMLEIIANAAKLHDIGMIGIPDKILLKDTHLSHNEMECIRKHPSIGVTMLQHVSFLDRERLIILHHHEWFNGSGYPSRIRGERIPIGARIIAVADAYVAMCHDRSHRKGKGHEAAVEELLRDNGKQFDPLVVESFIRAVARVEQPMPS